MDRLAKHKVFFIPLLFLLRGLADLRFLLNFVYLRPFLFQNNNFINDLEYFSKEISKKDLPIIL